MTHELTDFERYLLESQELLEVRGKVWTHHINVKCLAFDPTIIILIILHHYVRYSVRCSFSMFTGLPTLPTFLIFHYFLNSPYFSLLFQENSYFSLLFFYHFRYFVTTCNNSSSSEELFQITNGLYNDDNAK